MKTHLIYHSVLYWFRKCFQLLIILEAIYVFDMNEIKGNKSFVTFISFYERLWWTIEIEIEFKLTAKLLLLNI